MVKKILIFVLYIIYVFFNPHMSVVNRESLTYYPSSSVLNHSNKFDFSQMLIDSLVSFTTKSTL